MNDVEFYEYLYYVRNRDDKSKNRYQKCSSVRAFSGRFPSHKSNGSSKYPIHMNAVGNMTVKTEVSWNQRRDSTGYKKSLVA